MFSRYQIAQMTAEELITYIATDYVELSQEKILVQRNDYIKACRLWREVHLRKSSTCMGE